MLLLRIACIFVALFIGPAFAQVTAANLFETIPSGDGNCGEHDLDGMVQEAITLNNRAIQVLNVLTTKKALSRNGDEGRHGELASTMWGVTWKSTFLANPFTHYSLSNSDISLLNEVKANYEMVNQKLNSNSQDDGKLVCGAEDWLYARYGDVTNENLKRLRQQGSVSEEKEAEEMRMWISKHWNARDSGDQDRVIADTRIVAAPPDSESNPKRGFCEHPAEAQTWVKHKLIMMCHHCFEETTLTKLFADQDSWTKGKSINEIKTAGSIFQHEMFHYIDQDIADLDLGEGSYGWYNCLRFALDKENKANKGPVKNADNYRMFATAVFFDRVTWNEYGEKE